MEQFFQDLRRLVASGATDESLVRALLALTPHVPRLNAARLPAEGYRRVLLHAEDSFELLMMQWNGTIETPVHDHGGQRCWFSVIDGAIGVENYECTSRDEATAALRPRGRAILEARDTDARLTDDDLHKCFVPRGYATSLHLYASPLVEYNVYDLQTRQMKKHRSQYDERCLLG